MRLTLVFFAFLLAACAEKPAALGGDPEQGKLLLRQYGCGTCHEIPKVATADGKVGPPLTRLAKRVYLAGSIPNTPENLSRWIQAPQEFEPRTAMPDMGVTDAHARDMTAYLHTLQ